MDYSQSFKALLHTVGQLLDDILEAQGPQSSWSEPSLSDTAQSLIDGYLIMGLDPGLTPSEIPQGILDCETAIQFMKDHESDLDLTNSEYLDLKETLNEMKQELENEL